jgi:hypothetical protein
MFHPTCFGQILTSLRGLCILGKATKRRMSLSRLYPQYVAVFLFTLLPPVPCRCSYEQNMLK